MCYLQLSADPGLFEATKGRWGVEHIVVVHPVTIVDQKYRNTFATKLWTVIHCKKCFWFTNAYHSPYMHKLNNRKHYDFYKGVEIRKRSTSMYLKFSQPRKFIINT